MSTPASSDTESDSIEMEMKLGQKIKFVTCSYECIYTRGRHFFPAQFRAKKNSNFFPESLVDQLKNRTNSYAKLSIEEKQN